MELGLRAPRLTRAHVPPPTTACNRRPLVKVAAFLAKEEPSPAQAAARPPAVARDKAISPAPSQLGSALSSASSQWARYLLLQELSATWHSPAAPAASGTEAVRLRDLLGAYHTPLAALAAFILIAVDVNAPSSLHLLPQLDLMLHQAVVSTTSPEWRAGVADILVSDSFITTGLWGWLLTTAVCLRAAPRRTALPLSLCWLAYFSTCGAVLKDPPLVDLLKHFFARARPSELHHTFSFPSGHTAAAVFIVGGLVSVLMPLSIQAVRHAGSRTAGAGAAAVGVAGPAMEAASQQQQQEEEEQQGPEGSLEAGPMTAEAQEVASFSSSTSSTAASTSSSSAAVQAGAVDGERAAATWMGLAVWASAGLTTAAGRVLADAHWLSDTLAGGALAVAVVGGLNLLIARASKD